MFTPVNSTFILYSLFSIIYSLNKRELVRHGEQALFLIINYEFNFQSIGSNPLFFSISFVLEKCLQPKNPP